MLCLVDCFTGKDCCVLSNISLEYIPRYKIKLTTIFWWYLLHWSFTRFRAILCLYWDHFVIPPLYMICSDPADLLIQIVVYFLLAISLEYIPHYKIKLTSRIWLRILHYVKYDTSQSYFDPLLGSYVDSSMLITDEDVDVTAERHRILSGLGDDAIIILRNLKKVLVNSWKVVLMLNLMLLLKLLMLQCFLMSYQVYPIGKKRTAKVAVHSLTFSVHEGECFGFLGTNGAGKTTTLSMLTGKCAGYLFC